MSGFVVLDLSLPLTDPRSDKPTKAPMCDMHADRWATHWVNASRQLLCCECWIAAGNTPSIAHPCPPVPVDDKDQAARAARQTGGGEK